MNQQLTLAPAKETTRLRTACQPFFKALIRSLSVGLLLFLPLRAHSQDIPAGASYELGFWPGGTSLTVVLHGIEAAKTSLLVACYEFTSRPIAQALIDAAHRGVRVAIVADYKASLERYSLIGFLAKSGIPVRRDSRYAIEHDEFVLIDSEDIESGSFNYTSAAFQSNAQNALVLWHVPDIAAQDHPRMATTLG